MLKINILLLCTILCSCNSGTISPSQNVNTNVDQNSSLISIFRGEENLFSCKYANDAGVTRYIQFSNSTDTTFDNWVFTYYTTSDCTGRTLGTRTFSNIDKISTKAGTHIPCDVNNFAFRNTSGRVERSIKLTWNWSAGSNSICYDSRSFNSSVSPVQGNCSSTNCSFTAGSTSVFPVN